MIEGDLDLDDWHERVEGRYESVVNCVSSAGGGLAGYQKSYVDGQRSILEWAKSQSIRSYVYTSSTSVYPQDDGLLIDESADTSGAPATGQLLVESEVMLAKSDILPKWYVLRLAGIYGEGRHFLLNQIREAKGEIPGSGDYAMNMIHLEDIISAICAALCGEAASDVYNITDDAPTIKADVLAYLAEAMELPNLSSTQRKFPSVSNVAAVVCRTAISVIKKLVRLLNGALNFLASVKAMRAY